MDSGRALAPDCGSLYSEVMSRRGQASVEYMLLLCAVVTMALLTGAFIAKFGRDAADRMAEKVLDAVIVLALP